MSPQRLLNISEAASLALHACLQLARQSPVRLSARRIARDLAVSEHHLTKVLTRLSRFGILSSTRGAHGGFRLARGSNEVTLLRIYEAVEGPLTEELCLLSKPVCVNRACLFGSLVATVSQLVKTYLAETTLADLLAWQKAEPPSNKKTKDTQRAGPRRKRQRKQPTRRR